jgi:hypothetical protein
MKLPRSTAYALTALLLAGALGVGVSTAAESKRVKTKVTITFQGSDYGDAFSGKVKPKKATGKVKRKRRRGRAVTVFRRTSTGKQRIGRDRTNRRGRYVVSVGGIAASGRYFARAKRKRFTRGDQRVVCKKRKSKPITVS